MCAPKINRIKKLIIFLVIGYYYFFIYSYNEFSQIIIDLQNGKIINEVSIFE